MTEAGFAFLLHEEGLRTDAYQDKAGVWTIGIGMTRYPEGRRVQPGDTCTVAQAHQWFRTLVTHYAQSADDLTRDDLTPSQLDALTSFCYNAGVDAFRKSALRTVINQNPTNRLGISSEWRRWKYSGGKIDPILVGRRDRELRLYFGD